MKMIQALMAAALCLVAAAAHAESEGNGDPFPFQVPGTVMVAGPTAPFAASALRAPAEQPVRKMAEAVRPMLRHTGL